MLKIKKSKKPIRLSYLDDFLLYLQTNNYSPETIYNYERDLKTFETFLSSINIPFEKIDKKTILNYKAYLISSDRTTPLSGEISKKRFKSRSLNRTLSSLRSYLSYLVKMDYPTPVDVKAVELSKTERLKSRVPEWEDLIKLLEAPSQFEKNKLVALRNRAMLEVLMATGMRISELCNLKKDQIDRVGRIFIMGKGMKQRFVYLTPRGKIHLEHYLKTRNDPSTYVFVPYRGRNVAEKNKKISPNYFQEKVIKYRKLLGINVPISAHSIRHAFATYLAEKGASPAAIQTLLGHESLDTTTRYVRTSDKFAEETIKKFHPLKKE